MEVTNQQFKFCMHCGEKIPFDAVFCIKCGRQVELLQNSGQAPAAQPIIIYNNNTNVVGNGSPLNKWLAFILCLFFGFLGVHKFYEGKTGMGILYIFTCGVFGIGWLIDTIVLLFKPNPYYV